MSTQSEPTVKERWDEHQMLLEVFRMCSWGGLELFFEPPETMDQPGTLYLQATAMPVDRMELPPDERRTSVTVIAFNVHYGPPPLFVEQQRRNGAEPEQAPDG